MLRVGMDDGHAPASVGGGIVEGVGRGSVAATLGGRGIEDSEIPVAFRGLCSL